MRVNKFYNGDSQNAINNKKLEVEDKVSRNLQLLNDTIARCQRPKV